jgi:hypothetical protein
LQARAGQQLLDVALTQRGRLRVCRGRTVGREEAAAWAGCCISTASLRPLLLLLLEGVCQQRGGLQDDQLAGVHELHEVGAVRRHKRARGGLGHHTVLEVGRRDAVVRHVRRWRHGGEHVPREPPDAIGNARCQQAACDRHHRLERQLRRLHGSSTRARDSRKGAGHAQPLQQLSSGSGTDVRVTPTSCDRTDARIVSKAVFHGSVMRVGQLHPTSGRTCYITHSLKWALARSTGRWLR